MLEIKNLSVSYGRHRAVENVSANISMGEIVVMLGANGAGKSTLLRAIGGQTPVSPAATRDRGIRHRDGAGGSWGVRGTDGA